MKKNLITLLCLLSFACCVQAETYQMPGSYTETVTETKTDNPQIDKSAAKTEKKFFKKKRKEYNPTNTYWNFGRPPFWTGTY